MASPNTKFALYGGTNECPRTNTLLHPLSEVSTGAVSLKSKLIKIDIIGSILKFWFPASPSQTQLVNLHFFPSWAELGSSKLVWARAQPSSDFDFVSEPSKASQAQPFWPLSYAAAIKVPRVQPMAHTHTQTDKQTNSYHKEWKPWRNMSQRFTSLKP